jgi:hypothetical protein
LQRWQAALAGLEILAEVSAPLAAVLHHSVGKGRSSRPQLHAAGDGDAAATLVIDIGSSGIASAALVDVRTTQARGSAFL